MKKMAFRFFLHIGIRQIHVHIFIIHWIIILDLDICLQLLYNTSKCHKTFIQNKQKYQCVFKNKKVNQGTTRGLEKKLEFPKLLDGQSISLASYNNKDNNGIQMGVNGAKIQLHRMQLRFSIKPSAKNIYRGCTYMYNRIDQIFLHLLNFLLTKQFH